MAQRVERRYEALRRHPAAERAFPPTQWDDVGRLQERLGLAVERGHAAVAEELGYRLRQALQRLAGELTTAANAIARQTSRSDLPSLRLIYEELAGLEENFELVRLDLKESQIVVATERIELEDVDLGPFEIRLKLNTLGNPQPYEVVALEPYRPASNGSVTHPHVQHDVLCEGDGRTAIERALEQGRLGDFFLVVEQILRTYNPVSAYHALEAWDGSPCADCGELVDDDDRYSCDRCDCRLCGECTRSCTRCDNPICGECSTGCESCGSRTCDGCVERCTKCEMSTCRDCLEDNLCPTCRKPSEENPDAELEVPDAVPPAAPTPRVAAADPPVHSVCLGQAAVPARPRSQRGRRVRNRGSGRSASGRGRRAR
jgi:hypothetical protein